MLLYEKEITIPAVKGHRDLLSYLKKKVLENLPANEIPIRFVVTQSNAYEYQCEVGVLTNINGVCNIDRNAILDFHKRKYESADQFNVALLVPTGIGAEIGGHAGDAGAVARLIAKTCDTLITHPNVVNASDINELAENGLYIEGSIITRLLMGLIGLKKVRANRVLMILDKHEDKFFLEAAINSISAARSTFGFNCPKALILDDNVLMRAEYSSSGRAAGRIERFEHLCGLLEEYRQEYDAIGMASIIQVPRDYHALYFNSENMLNPWGGVEAMLTHAISTIFNVPSAHSPMLEDKDILDDAEWGIVDPRKAAEAVSVTFLHCILKGLHRSPQIITDKTLFNSKGVLDASDISCLVIPDGCIGLPTLAALEQGIPVIAVKENKNQMKNSLEELPFAQDKLFIVDNYLEAVGVINALKAGVTLESVRRPLGHTKVKELNSPKVQELNSPKVQELDAPVDASIEKEVEEIVE